MDGIGLLKVFRNSKSNPVQPYRHQGLTEACDDVLLYVYVLFIYLFIHSFIYLTIHLFMYLESLHFFLFMYYSACAPLYCVIIIKYILYF